MSGSSNRDPSLAQQTGYARQAVILRKNLTEWDRQVRTTASNGSAAAEDWPRSLGRLNAALHQAANMDQSISDVMEHFVYLPKKAVANPGDIPVFLSTRLEDEAAVATTTTGATTGEIAEFSLDTDAVDTVKILADYENNAAALAAEYERTMVRF
jgi:hypothetical protein